MLWKISQILRITVYISYDNILLMFVEKTVDLNKILIFGTDNDYVFGIVDVITTK